MALQMTNSWDVDKTDNPQIVTQSNHAVNPARICVWCKGLRIDATINVTQYVAEPNTTWEVGLVQILEYSKMKAHYGDMVVEWVQTVVPCYDSTDNTCIPWYTNQTFRQITGTGQFVLTLQDYPTSHLDPYLVNPGGAGDGNALTHYIKHNKFNAYLLFRKTVNAATTDSFLKHCRWETKAAIRPNNVWNANMYSPAGYQRVNHNRNASWVYKVISPFHKLPPVTSGSANGAINQVLRQAVHRYRLFHH